MRRAARGYFAKVLAAGRTVVGIDQSACMLARARTKHPEVVLEKVGLQELDYQDDFDGAMCIDAMEYVFPEDWPVVLGNLHTAVRSCGLIYLTVERVDEAELASVFAEAKADGLPVVYGENLRRGGYHYYRARSDRWVARGRRTRDRRRRLQPWTHLQLPPPPRAVKLWTCG